MRTILVQVAVALVIAGVSGCATTLAAPPRAPTCVWTAAAGTHGHVVVCIVMPDAPVSQEDDSSPDDGGDSSDTTMDSSTFDDTSDVIDTGVNPGDLGVDLSGIVP